MNGNVNINKTVELDAEVAKKLGGSNRDEAILELCRIYYPGVKVEKGKVAVNIIPIKENSSQKSSAFESQKSSQNYSARNTDFETSEKRKSNNSSGFSGGNLLKTAGSFALGSITNSIMNEISGNIAEESERKLEISEFKSRKNDIIYSEIPKDKSGLFQYANNLIAELKSSGWSDEKDHKNEFANACLSKLEQSKYLLIGLGAIQEANYLDNEIKKLKRKKFTQKYLAVIFGMAFLGIMFILYLLGIIHD